MDGEGWDAVFKTFLSSFEGDRCAVDTPRVLPGITAFLVRSFDGSALQFSFPLLVRRDLLSGTGLDPAGSDGAVNVLIERIKAEAYAVPELGPLYGNRIPGSLRYHDTIEPDMVIHSDDAIGSHLWEADDRNYCDPAGVHLIVCGALPCPSNPVMSDNHRIVLQLAGLAEAVAGLVQKIPLHPLRAAWLSSLDQKLLRRELPKQGLVSFIGDSSRLARTFTRNRLFFRVAGPKERASIPFCCPRELEPVELELPTSNRTVTGLGIRKREVLAIAGSNAQGKTTFLEGILAGMDDHSPHDGRELVVTVRGACSAESTNMGLAGADISMFFHALPPGVSGTIHSVHGTGSGSMMMASQVQNAVMCHAPCSSLTRTGLLPTCLSKAACRMRRSRRSQKSLAGNAGRWATQHLFLPHVPWIR